MRDVVAILDALPSAEDVRTTFEVKARAMAAGAAGRRLADEPDGLTICLFSVDEIRAFLDGCALALRTLPPHLAGYFFARAIAPVHPAWAARVGIIEVVAAVPPVRTLIWRAPCRLRPLAPSVQSPGSPIFHDELQEMGWTKKANRWFPR